MEVGARVCVCVFVYIRLFTLSGRCIHVRLQPTCCRLAKLIKGVRQAVIPIEAIFANSNCGQCQGSEATGRAVTGRRDDERNKGMWEFSEANKAEEQAGSNLQKVQLPQDGRAATSDVLGLLGWVQGQSSQPGSPSTAITKMVS